MKGKTGAYAVCSFFFFFFWDGSAAYQNRVLPNDQISPLRKYFDPDASVLFAGLP